MNIFLDAQPLLGSKSGVARYIDCLYSELSTHHNSNVYLAFNRIIKGINLTDITDRKPGRIINQRYPYKVIRRLLNPNFLYDFPYDFFKFKKADIFHGTNFTHNATRKGKSIITIHDLAFLRFPETTSEKIYKHHSKWVPYSARKCDHIIAVSEQTKNDIVELLRVPEYKISTIYSAADTRFFKLPEPQYFPVIQHYQLPERYILFVGTVEPRKNLLGLLKSYLIFRKNSALSDKLVIVGAKGWKYSPIFDFIKENNLESEVIFTGYIEDEHLPAIYNGATLFVMPSIYEGFGIPILEAMGCGVPVIGSNVSSIPEVIDSFGVMVSPTDYEGWAAEIHRFLSDESLRNKYSKLSLERASHFSWKRTAEATKQVYIDVLNSNLPVSKGLSYENSVSARLPQSVRGSGTST
ncbi:glycosyltransferase family 4 protein [Paenibacillus sp. GYB003]|uniref:glycosyltransferase family 4 protein n=1 Tax=Paenibacillus sp. GYB003 TaxID=2994392 RepID=UPI002F968873